ncbi:hypothetical protein [Bacillus thuringiensis]|uniref:SMI1/KNR4 family protein n=1 Tax=Bacillus thuringiensis subsp. higo TaxID=132266 RepID=A0A9X6LE36_BACUH|nr:hypothetical protein [Bacillus thuringiensis]AKR11802.1 hypothetical protein AC241_24640 [Bacillus thuringiensis]MBZ8122595.1 hypothetical protein [Bacillus thuringiensis]MCU7673892.1 hypothetical protein [Bacillus thuringiensis]MDM8360275.1 hypothetical protein [Bacillus thuringiensis]MED2803817.1 hypothetical protein [Bacillus thuringiensis]
MINHNKIKQLLAHVDRAEDNEIELEYESEPMTIELFNSEEIEEGQLGYSFDEEGQSLVGNEEGDWKEGWIVIGIDSYLGDPIFVDSNDEDCPVYTAMHGEGDWELECIAERIEDIIEKVKGNVREIK